MSYTSLYKVFGTKRVEIAEFRNGHGSAPPVWDYLTKNFLGGKYWFSAGDALWKLAWDKRVPLNVRICHGLNVAVVCHSVIVLSFRATLEKWQEDDYLQVDKENDVKNASVTHYAYETVEKIPVGGLSNAFYDHKKLVLKEYNTIFWEERALATNG